MKEYYVKCASKEQAQAFRPHLVEFGFEDDAKWNDSLKNYISDCSYILIHKENTIEIANHDNNYPLLYSLPDNADLSEMAKTIKELLVNPNGSPER